MQGKHAHAEDRRCEIQRKRRSKTPGLTRGADRCYFRILLIGKLTTHQHSSAPKPGRRASGGLVSQFLLLVDFRRFANRSIPFTAKLQRVPQTGFRLTLRLETHDESAGRVYRRHGRVAMDRIGHLSSGTTPPHTKGLKAHAYPHTHRASLAPLVATGLMP